MDGQENKAVFAPDEVKPRKALKRRMLIMAMASMLMTVSAFASEGNSSDAAVIGLASIFDYMDEVTQLCTQVWTMLTSNAYFTLYLAVGLLGVGIGVFRRIKRVARH